MSGLKRHQRSGSFVIVNLELVAEFGGWDAAGVLQRVEWRCSDNGGEWVAKIEDIAAEIYLSVHRTRQALNMLVERGYLTRRRASGYDPTPVWEVVMDESEDPDPLNSPSSKKSKNVPRESGRTFDGKVDALPIEKVDNTPLPPDGGGEGLFLVEESQTSKPDLMDGFEEWYALYPRKRSKGDAEKAWMKTRRAGVPAGVIMAALRRQHAALVDAKARGVCKYPASWLNAKAWTDEEDEPLQRPHVPSPDEQYDPEWERRLPPPPKMDMYG